MHLLFTCYSKIALIPAFLSSFYSRLQIWLRAQRRHNTATPLTAATFAAKILNEITSRNDTRA